jgi:uncharacterized protein
VRSLNPLRSTFFRREAFLSLVALVFLLAALLTVYALSPTRLRVAVPGGEPASKLVEAWAQSLTKSGAEFRLEIISTSSLEEAAGLLQAGKVELAVVRPDKVLPDRGMTVALLSVQAIVLAVLPGRGIDAVEELSGRRIGVLKGVADAPPMISRLARIVGWVKPPIVVPLDDSDLASRDALQKVDALLHVAPLSGSEFSSLFAKLAGALGGRTAEIITFENAAALAQRDPTFEEVELEAGSLSSKPKRPDEKSSTLGVSVRLMAHTGSEPWYRL